MARSSAPSNTKIAQRVLDKALSSTFKTLNSHKHKDSLAPKFSVNISLLFFKKSPFIQR